MGTFVVCVCMFVYRYGAILFPPGAAEKRVQTHLNIFLYTHTDTIIAHIYFLWPAILPQMYGFRCDTRAYDYVFGSNHTDAHVQVENQHKTHTYTHTPFEVRSRRVVFSLFLFFRHNDDCECSFIHLCRRRRRLARAPKLYNDARRNITIHHPSG